MLDDLVDPKSNDKCPDKRHTEKRRRQCNQRGRDRSDAVTRASAGNEALLTP